MEEKKKTTAAKSTQAAKEVREFIKANARRPHEAKERGEKVAWAMMGIPFEIVKAMDIAMFFPEPYASLISAKRMETSYIDKAQSAGYALSLCSYCTVGLGYASIMAELGGVPPADAPDRGMLKPDMMLTSDYTCDARQKFCEALNRYFNVPLACTGFVFPHHEGKFGDSMLDYQDFKYSDVKGYIKHRGYEHYVKLCKEELKHFIAFLEQQTGRKMDYDRLSEVMHIKHECNKLWWEILTMRKAVPGPLPAGDHLSIVYPYYWAACEGDALAFYRRARDEVKHRVENKIGVVPEEKYRLLWAGGVSPWHSMYMFNYFEEKFGAVVVMDCEVDFGRPIDVEDPDPLEVMAIRAAMHEGTNRYGIQLPERLVQWIKDYKIDGVLWHLTMSCHASTEGSLLSDLVIQQHLPVPSLVLESDLIDSRAFNEAEIKARIDAFMESVAANKEKKKRG